MGWSWGWFLAFSVLYNCTSVYNSQRFCHYTVEKFAYSFDRDMHTVA